jgi:Protein of unknown function (DUF4065)
MKSTAKDLVLSVLTRIKELDASVSKTKLLKLLYLADIEHFRATGDTLTGFDWIFYWYGPWSSDYDRLLDQMEAEAVLARTQWSAGGLDGERLSAVEPRDLAKIIADTNEYFRIRRLVDTFSDLATSNLLDFVYFDTEPMAGAEKGKRLDFSKISRHAPPFYRRSASGASSGRIRELQSRFREVKERISQESDANTRHFRSPSYDEHYWTAMEAFDKSGDE